MTNENDIIFDNLAEKVFPYLDEMYLIDTAVEYVIEEFGTNKDMARKLVQAWMETFKEKDNNE